MLVGFVFAWAGLDVGVWADGARGAYYPEWPPATAAVVRILQGSVRGGSTSYAWVHIYNGNSRTGDIAAG